MEKSMERIHGVDASWLHHSGKDHHHGRKNSIAKDPKTPGTPETLSASLPSVTTTKDSTSSSVSSPLSPRRHVRTGRPVSVESPIVQRSTSPARKGWLSSLSSKFSSTPQQINTLAPANVTAPARSPSPKLAQSPGKPDNTEKPYTPAIPKQNQPSFLQSAFRRLSSSGGGLSGSGKAAANGLCERRTLNIDKNRERCDIPDLKLSKLRRVAFCVDVEIASGPRYHDEEEDENQKKEKKQRKRLAGKGEGEALKLADKGEGEALKHPEGSKDAPDDNAIASSSDALIGSSSEANQVSSSNAAIGNSSDANLGHSSDAKIGAILQKESEQHIEQEGESGDTPESPSADNLDEEQNDAEKKTKKKEKKKQYEEDRKARKEKRKKQQQMHGKLPVELTRTDSDNLESSLTGTTSSTSSQASPTTDPVRIYRRCCQLRETPILKKITEQLANPANCGIGQPGYLKTLDLTNYPMNLADLVTLGDYLAVVPIKDVILENCGLTDEGVRVILAGLLATKQPEYGRRRRRHTLERVAKQTKQGGVVERLILKKNPKLGRAGWSHISLFIYMCHSIRYLDLSLNPFPSTNPMDVYAKLQRVDSRDTIPDTLTVLSKALAERHAKAELELLNMAETGLDTEQLGQLIDGVIKSGLKRLAIAGNHITAEGMDHVARYVKDGKCEGLDIGGNDIAEHLPKIADSLDENHPLWALGLADCNLTPDALWKLFPTLARLPNFKFIDLSHNHGVFEQTPSSLSLLRRYIPKMPHLKRVHLSDTAMSAAQAIALAEILPESPSLAHIILLENPALTALSNAKEESEQEEACALYASLLCAVRVSKTIICVDVDVPNVESSEIVKALAKQVVAYCLRNMEQGPVAEIDQAKEELSALHGNEIPMPDVLLHIVGHGEGEDSDDDPAPDEDYIIGGTGVAKALNICLRNSGNDMRRPGLDRTFTDAAERPMDALASTHISSGRAKEMSKNLLDSARRIRARLQAPILREARGNERHSYSRLQFLDQTLERTIKRFEDEYPEISVPNSATLPPVPSPVNGSPSGESVLSFVDDPDPVQIGSPADDEDTELNLNISMRPALSRHNSEVSLASKAQTQEEGRMHRVGQQFRRDILKPLAPDYLHSGESSLSSSPSKSKAESDTVASGSKSNAHEVFSQDLRHEPQHLQMLRALVEEVGGEDIMAMMKEAGPAGVMKELAGEEGEAVVLRNRLMEQDPVAWAKFKEAQEKAQRNSGVVPTIEFGDHDAEVGDKSQVDEDEEEDCAVESD